MCRDVPQMDVTRHVLVLCARFTAQRLIMWRQEHVQILVGRIMRRMGRLILGNVGQMMLLMLFKSQQSNVGRGVQGSTVVAHHLCLCRLQLTVMFEVTVMATVTVRVTVTVTITVTLTVMVMATVTVTIVKLPAVLKIIVSPISVLPGGVRAVLLRLRVEYAHKKHQLF
jgi:hypothetical protein